MSTCFRCHDTLAYPKCYLGCRTCKTKTCPSCAMFSGVTLANYRCECLNDGNASNESTYDLQTASVFFGVDTVKAVMGSPHILMVMENIEAVRDILYRVHEQGLLPHLLTKLLIRGDKRSDMRTFVPRNLWIQSSKLAVLNAILAFGDDAFHKDDGEHGMRVAVNQVLDAVEHQNIKVALVRKKQQQQQQQWRGKNNGTRRPASRPNSTRSTPSMSSSRSCSASTSPSSTPTSTSTEDGASLGACVESSIEHYNQHYSPYHPIYMMPPPYNMPYAPVQYTLGYQY